MNKSIIRKMEDRKYATVPVDAIKVLNSRNRDRGRFEENIRSIKDVGLLRPIVINERYSVLSHYKSNKDSWLQFCCSLKT